MHLPPIPILKDYGISPKHGFLPDDPPLAKLSDMYYALWEVIISNLQTWILSRRLRSIVNRLPVLSTAHLKHEAEWRRAYSILAFIAHGYIWGDDRPADRLPPAVAVPLLDVSKHLELPPVATYAALCLWNFKPLFEKEDIDTVENLTTLNTFTGSLDESWFYLISVALEARGAPMIPVMLKAIAATRQADAPAVTRYLCTFAEHLDELGSLLQRMHENCDSNTFFHRIRPFLAGSKDMAEAGLPKGIIYDDGSGVDKYCQYSGGSNAQSSMIQFFDIVLGIEHRPTGEKRDPVGCPDLTDDESTPPPPHNFIHDMRRYMPGPHARFLGHVESVANIRGFVDAHRTDVALCMAYDACLSMLGALRDKHLAIVTRYVILPSQAAQRQQHLERHGQHPPKSTGRTRFNLATATSPVIKGTGGSSLLAFLKQARDETRQPMIEGWCRHFVLTHANPIAMMESNRSSCSNPTNSFRNAEAETDPEIAPQSHGQGR